MVFLFLFPLSKASFTIPDLIYSIKSMRAEKEWRDFSIQRHF
jgi:hypothetical protein